MDVRITGSRVSSWRAAATRAVAAAAVACALLAPVASAAQQNAPDVRLDPVVVTTTRLGQKASEAPASVTVLTRTDVEQSAAQSVDDLLRQVPGFSLFRRSSSMVTHPTAQGVSLRGIGPSGASRALVLLDGVPLNDPFGGWVQWSRVPMLGLEQIEVVRGGGASVWGNGALGGVIHLISTRPTERRAFFEASYGTQDTWNLDLLVTEAVGPLRAALEINAFDTAGYHVVRHSDRGPIDRRAASEHRTINGRIELVETPDLGVFIAGNVFEEDRDNGTPIQINETRAALLTAGGRVRTAEGSEWTLHLSGQLQKFRSTFSAQAANRASEAISLDQHVPSSALGASLQWTRRFATHTLLSGIDGRWVEGETDEERYVGPARFLGTRSAGGEQVIAGAYVQDVYRPMRALELTGGVRADYWIAYDGFRHDRAPTGNTITQSFSDIDRLLVSPRLATLIRATDTTDVRASAYQGFRAPTLNELYRVFRVRNDVTTANEHLKPERLTGGEVGVQQRWGPVDGRITGFWNEVQDLVANVTLPFRLPDCPAGTTCRQRQNLDLARIRGIESEIEVRAARQWRVVGSHLYTHARVVDAPQERTLEGKRLAQVPEHSASLSLRYHHPSIVTGSVTARYVGPQFEDDQNALPLGGFWVFDAMLARALTKWADVFVAAENVLDRTYAVGRTSEGVVSIGAPFQARAGVRLNF